MIDFVASMPAAYARAFDAAAVAEHARIVGRRGTRLAHAELCRTVGGGVVCIVADDRPGLLALVTDALLVHGLGIRGAQGYCRQRPDGRAEAVDFLELHEQRASLLSGAGFQFDASELEAFLQTLTELIAEDIRVSARAGAAPVPRAAPTRVYFVLEALRQSEYVLLVETPDSDGLLHAITSALYAQGVRILACQIGTEAGVARDRFDLASVAGQPLSSAELCDIQLAVLDALPDWRG
jgi:UTP:GlnB (protein PII) uridylyltransferase